MNYTYDEIIASAYLVFKDDLTTIVISTCLNSLSNLGSKIKREDLKLKELKDVFEFRDYKYYLKKEYNIKKLEPFFRIMLIAIFEEVKKERNKYYEERCSVKRYRK